MNQRKSQNRGFEGIIDVGLEDPNSGEYTDAKFRIKIDYDSGNVGIGRDPHMAGWELDYIEVAEPFVISGRQFQPGEYISQEELAPFTGDTNWAEYAGIQAAQQQREKEQDEYDAAEDDYYTARREDKMSR